MKIKLFLILIVVFILNSCSVSNYQSRNIPRIQLVKADLNKFNEKSIQSIRAIEIINGSVFFMAHGGKIYTITKQGGYSVTPDDFFLEKPNFRASGYSGNNLFALSIENPALLYQIGLNEKNTLEKPKLVYTEKGEKVFYDALTFFDEKNGIAMGDPTEDCMSIILTNNKGKSWKKIPCDALPKILDGEAAFAASNTNIATYKNDAWIITGGKHSRVLYTKDKGKTWKIVDTPLINGSESTGGYSIAFSDANNGIICGGDYTNKSANFKNKAVTIDGGKTWELVSNGQEPGYISCVQYVPNTGGKKLFAVSTEGIYYSKDKGNTWAKVSEEGYYTIKFVDRNNAWLAGNGKIAKMILE